jgi:hypothetical protein
MAAPIMSANTSARNSPDIGEKISVKARFPRWLALNITAPSINAIGCGSGWRRCPAAPGIVEYRRIRPILTAKRPEAQNTFHANGSRLRDIEPVEELAMAADLSLVEIAGMPANNLTLVLDRSRKA